MPASVAIVTGGGRGIGRAIVERLAARHVVLFTFVADTDAARSLEQECEHRGQVVRGIRCDIADADAPSRILAAATELGDVTVLVGNAGITGRLGPLESLTDADLDRVFAVNATGPIRLARECVRAWGESEVLRHIVHVSSIAAVTGAPHEYTWYAASKAAIDAFTVGLGKEVGGRGIRVNAVHAGTTRTGIHAAAGDPDRADRVAARHPLGRVAEPREIADTVAWLVSAEASYVNGAVIDVTGGLP